MGRMIIPRSHCGYGHEFNEKNTYEWKGKRYCRRCASERYYLAKQNIRRKRKAI